MVAYEFLSPEWVVAAQEVRAEYAERSAPPATPIRVNLTITEMPFGPDPLRGFIDNSDGELVIEIGTLDNPDLAVTAPYDVVRRVFVEQDQAAGLEAFMGGTIQAEGDLSIFFAMQPQSVDPVAAELAQRINQITAR